MISLRLRDALLDGAYGRMFNVLIPHTLPTVLTVLTHVNQPGNSIAIDCVCEPGRSSLNFW